MSERLPVLVVDDEPDLCDLIEMALVKIDQPCVKAHSLAEARRCLQCEPFALCLTDMRLPDGAGIELVRLIQQGFKQMPVAMITAYGSTELAVEVLKAGAFDFICKPLDVGDLRTLVQTAVRPARPYTEQDDAPRLIGSSAVMQELRRMITKIARSQAPVHIHGESGVGKELVARLVHEHSSRATGPFVPVNCGAIPESLLESEFFGHLKGSFTGAVADKPGLFRAADGGTLFLDEVADLPLLMQVKLLRAIQERCVRPVGGEQEQRVDVRLLSATHQSLADAVQQGRFRQDLFYRLHVLPLTVPALRQRRDDLPDLVQGLLQRITPEAASLQVSEEAWHSLQQHDFPGNVRELENMLERAVALADDGWITPQTLGVGRIEQDIKANRLALPKGMGMEGFLLQTERSLIEAALVDNEGNKTAAARQLGISLSTLRYRMGKLNMVA